MGDCAGVVTQGSRSRPDHSPDLVPRVVRRRGRVDVAAGVDVDERRVLLLIIASRLVPWRDDGAVRGEVRRELIVHLKGECQQARMLRPLAIPYLASPLT